MLFHVMYRDYDGNTQVGRVGVADSATRSSQQLRQEAIVIARSKYPYAKSITSAVAIPGRPQLGRRG